MQKHIGNLIINENDNRDFSKLEEVTGDLSINSNASLEAKALTTVGGYLYINSNASLEALTTVGGYLSINSNASLEAKALTTVGGDLSINSNASLGALTTVGGYLYINSNASLEALTTVGGDLYINSNASLGAKFLKNITWKHIDNSLFIIESTKTFNGFTIYSGFNAKGVVDSVLVKQPTIYVAEKIVNDIIYYAHGSTVKKAIEDVKFKIVSEKLKNDPIHEKTLLTVMYYRLITGSCDSGCRSWMKSNNIPYKVIDEGKTTEHTVEVEPILAKELLQLLEKTHAYGLDRFKKLLTFKK
jgi:acyl-[acyl carrier protein]--UDP-N-acetylglucosamine O-acyltransferase